MVKIKNTWVVNKDAEEGSESYLDEFLDGITFDWVTSDDPEEAINEILGEVVADYISHVHPFGAPFHHDEQTFIKIKPDLYRVNFRGGVYYFSNVLIS